MATEFFLAYGTIVFSFGISARKQNDIAFIQQINTIWMCYYIKGGLQMIVQIELKPAAPPSPAEAPEPDIFWLPPAKTRILH